MSSEQVPPDTHSDTSEDSPSPQSVAPRTPYAILLYTLARIGLLFLVGFVLYLLGMRSILLIVVAFLISGLLSFFLLDRLRDAVSARFADRLARSKQASAARAAAEDEDLL